MFGSPVVYYKDRAVTMVNKQGGMSRHRTKFVGIYSGRIGANSDSRNDAQLGRIWKSHVIDDILSQYRFNAN